MFNLGYSGTRKTLIPVDAERSSIEEQPFASHKQTMRPDAPVPPRDHHDEVLARPAFLAQLQRERRRADRSGMPLSVIVFRPELDRTHSPSAIHELLRALKEGTRETDMIGSIGSQRIAVLLVDTDLHGAQMFVRKIATGVGDLPFEVAKGSYPGQIFDAISGGKADLAEFRSLFVEEIALPSAGGYRLKRVLDVVGAFVALALASPLMAATAIAVRLSSPGSVIFRQERLGLHGKPFVFYKFRSMYIRNDDSIHREFVSSLIQGEHDAVNQGDVKTPSYKLKHDPRVTRVGRFIRRTSLDELPQLFNVLKGDMSLVGPRPALGYEVEKYRSWHLRRVLEVRPGITGYWQVAGRSRTTFDEMVRMDLRYVRSCSLRTDLGLLMRTVTAVIKRDGAG